MILHKKICGGAIQTPKTSKKSKNSVKSSDKLVDLKI